MERATLRRETLGIVFQQLNLIPSLTVRDNLAFQARIAGRFDAAWQDELIVRLGLQGLNRPLSRATFGRTTTTCRDWTCDGGASASSAGGRAHG